MCKHAAAVLNTTRSDYYKNCLKSAETKKDVYSTVNKLMDRDLGKKMLPNNDSEEVLCEKMKTFFHSKVQGIYSGLEEQHSTFSENLPA